MKLTKKLEAEILEVYNAYWDAFLKGDIKSIASLVDDNCHVIGSSVGEVFNDRRSLLKYLKATIGQIKEKAELRNRKIRVTTLGKDIMINDESDLYLLIDGTWTFYGHGRASTLFSKKGNKWKIIHLHRSLPDSKAEEGEQVNTDKIKAENIQLRDAVKRRTEELENKNRELEIESALERVRARAMAMQSSDELIEVANVLRQQMVELGQSGFDTAAVHLYPEDSEYFDSWYSFRQGDPVTGKVVTGKTKFKKDEGKMVREMVKAYHSKQNDYTLKASGEKLKEWFSLLKKTIPEIKINLDKNPGSNYIHFSDFSGGSLVIATFQPPTRDSVILQKRCATVFDLAYRRYVDLKKAEAQAREAQIELALERVRAKTMAMQEPSEFVDLVSVIGEQFVHLGFDIEWANFGANGLDVTNGIDIWNFAVIPGLYQAAERLYIPYIDHPVFAIAAAGLEKYQRTGEDFFVIDLNKKDKDRWMDHMYTKSAFKEMPDEFKSIQYNKPGYTSSLIVLKDSWLSIGKFDPKPFTEEQNAILRRFANAFGQAYTRFLDLQKAEAQAREAKIELALERVRARAMAMHNTNELAELVSTVFNELTQLDFRLTSCIIWIHDHENTKNTLWIASAEMNKPAEPFLVNAFHNDFFKSVNHAWKSKDTKWVYTFTGKEKKNFERAFFKELPQLPIALKNALEVPKQVVFSASFNNFGALEIVETEALTDEKFEILHRFGKVFDSSYTRFNDLKKAEAQAREAQIETGLERVRSKTMAMHKSEEVTGIAVSLNEELLKLGFEGGSTIIIVDKETGDTEQWTGFSEDKTLKSCNVPYFKHPCHDALLDTWKRGEKFLVYTLSGEEKKTLDEHYFATGYKDFPESDKKWMRQMGSVTFSYAFMKYGAIHWGPDNLSEEQLKILQRFAKVFEQSYTRFLDLQKAEIQAREAQIELALERVRAKTMAMQKPSEFVDVINVIGEQFVHLGFDIEWANFGANGFNVSEGIDIWNFALVPGASPISARVFIPYFDHPVFTTSVANINEFINGGRDLIIVILDKQAKDSWLDHLFTKTIFKDVPGEYRSIQYAKPGYTTSNISIKDTWLSIGKFDTKAFTDEQHAILRKFAKAFGQAYTRFLDLQKAETLAREATIEAALERVRSRSMAMHKSDDLHEVIKVVTEQLSVLGLKFNVANFAKIGPEGSWDLWLSTPDQTYPALIHVPYIDHPIFSRITEEGKKGSDFFTDVYTREEANIFFHHFFENTIAKNTPEERKQFVYNSKGFTRSIFLTKNIWFSVSRYDTTPFIDEENAIFKRFAKVFEQAYTRFLDLQKAEAQAREAQIEASLERVRSRAMAMQNSDELRELIGAVFTELTKLDIVLTRCLIMIYDPRSNDSVWWMANSEAPTEPIGLRIQNHGHPPYVAYLRAWQEKKLNWVYVLEGAVKKDWDNFLFVETELSHLPHFVIAGMKAPERVYLNSSFNSFGNLTLATLEPLSTEHFDILLRFAKVFDLTYTRFNDLKQAEAQAKESGIQLALERVRARTMAMQKSDELPETSFLLFQQFKELGSVANQLSIGIINEQENVMEISATIDGSKLDNTVNVSLQEPIVMKKLVVAWKEQKRSLVLDLSGDELKTYNDYRSSIGKLNFETKEGEHWVIHIAFFSKGILSFSSHEHHPDEIVQLLERFAGVFDHTYRRFLDLQKAEAQTREAQIELALERVRARTMAMHKSEELSETAQVLFHQLSELGGIPDRISIGIADEVNGVVNFWTTDQQGSHLDHSFSARLNERTTIAKTYQAWKEQKKSLVVDLHGDELNEWIQFAREEMGIAVKDDQIKDRRVHSLAFFSHGWILVTSHEPQSTETIQILERFASVFNLTYRRFLDLQKAEAQAREAQIEMALERVRSKTMAMQRSEELDIVIKTVYSELKHLDVLFDRCFIMIFDEQKGATWWMGSPEDDLFHEGFYVQYHTHPPHLAYLKGWEERQQKWEYRLGGQIKNDWDEFLFYKTELSKLPPIAIQYMKAFESAHLAASFENFGCMTTGGQERLSEESFSILSRFAKVFDQTYTRFKDLKQAEAQAREAQIEMALEKIRSRSLAMHKSDELQEVVNTVFERLKDLDIEVDSSNIAIFKEGSRDFDYWIASNTQKRAASFHMPYIDLSLTKDIVAARESGADFSATSYPFEVKNEWFDFAFKETDFKFLSEERKQFIFNSPGITVGIAFSKHTGVQVNRYSDKLLSEGEADILKRFSKVFEQAYIRFLDLEKAEAQAREAQIEASLERVRSKTMAMHNSQDVGETVATMFDQLVKLGVTTNRCGILIFSNTNNTEVWTAKSNQNGEATLIIGHLDVTIHPMLQGVRNAWKNKETFFSYELTGENIKDYYSVINNYPDYPTRFNLDSLPQKEIHSDFFFPDGAVFAFTSDPITAEISQIFKRFAGVFGQTYRRYLDLQKAEANARESQIEAGLERVRARTMAMHSSEDVSIATATMFTELEKLGIENLRGGITIIKPDDKQEVWGVTNLPDGRTIRSIGVFDMHLHPLWRELLKAQLNKGDYNYYRLAGKDKEDYINILNATPNYLSQPIKEFPDVHVQSYFFGEGAIWTNSLEPHSEEQKQTMKRFASVFALTFRRYQDLKKAEAQAREATVETALEKVRGKAMAMHNSHDLTATASLVFTELRKLGISPMRCGVGMLNRENRKALLYTAIASEEGDSLSQIGWVLLDVDPVLRSIYDHWGRDEDYFPVLKKEMLRSFYEQLRSGFEVPEEQTKYEHHGYFLTFSEGVFYGWSEKPFTESEIKVLKRFASVIDLTFRRYIELQKSEGNAREAVKQAALDRVRAEIASMRTVNDLDRITPLIWNELTILGIPFIRCGVFIMDDEQQLIHTFLSTPDGKAIAAFHLPYDTPGNLRHVVTNWKNNKKYIDHWDETEFIQFADILVKGGALVSAEQYLKTIPKGGFYLHFLPFLQGMLYVGNTTQLKQEEIELIQHVADAFSTAYARYEDFNKLESAKQQVEKTLTDLKQAQTQLVQSEKMASLGELTAGIAHEIQNPLNFVNNFSEVSKELLDEMKTELETGNTEDAKDIADDVIQNLEKINHHGKRADAIVKSMLQHSRSSSGKKEPADINGLADEYLRLAYHGLRAKDKSFNAKFETEFDSSIGKINIISQDIGRVLVNLINNAFYAVSERKKQESNGYEPTVTVHTRKIDDKIEIKVRDNGNGIPQKVLDKIFQPFFTTKPTGQGTGLGLSLAYDIVTKGHGGELKVETREGEGSEFIIQLPASKATES